MITGPAYDSTGHLPEPTLYLRIIGIGQESDACVLRRRHASWEMNMHSMTNAPILDAALRTNSTAPHIREVPMTACIIGWAHTPFGKLEGETVESLIVRVANEALADAVVEAKDVDEIVLGHFNAGFSAQDFTAALVLQASQELRFKPATRVENACATGSAAVHQGIKAIAAGQARIVLAVGVEQMTTTPGPEIGKNLLKASYVRDEAEIDGGFAGIFGKIAGLYFQRYGDQSDALAMIAAKNHKNGVGNPFAQMRKDLGFAFCRAESEKNPIVAGPLKRTDCSLVSDGAAAVVLADVETALAMKKAVAFRAAAHVQDFLPMAKRDILKFEGCAQAWQQALTSARIALDDLSLVETHDCFTIAELIEYEAMGLAPEGQGARAIAEGWTQKDGRLPVNASGGLKAKGHPIGATGVSMHALAAMQLTGAAGDMQVKGATLAGIFNMGGAAVANYVSVLERIK
jgi:acetyl-CoA C-acetyltransferase